MMGRDEVSVTRVRGPPRISFQYCSLCISPFTALAWPACTEWMGAMDNDQNRREVSWQVGGWAPSSVQAKILEGVAAGSSSGRLSRELHLSSKTIDYHVRVMSDKLQVPNRVALVSRAYVLQILRTDSWPPRIACETAD